MAMANPTVGTGPAGGNAKQLTGEWKQGLFGCFSDIPSCFLSCCCPCVQYGMNKEKVDNDSCFMSGLIYCCLMSCRLQCLVHMNLREGIRNKFGIQGSTMSDFLLTWCCQCCALAQEAGQLRD